MTDTISRAEAREMMGIVRGALRLIRELMLKGHANPDWERLELEDRASNLLAKLSQPQSLGSPKE